MRIADAIDKAVQGGSLSQAWSFMDGVGMGRLLMLNQAWAPGVPSLCDQGNRDKKRRLVCAQRMSILKMSSLSSYSWLIQRLSLTVTRPDSVHLNSHRTAAHQSWEANRLLICLTGPPLQHSVYFQHAQAQACTVPCVNFCHMLESGCLWDSRAHTL